MYFCGPGVPETTRIQALPTIPTVSIEPGEHFPGLGGLRVINRSVAWRDGLLYIPRVSRPLLPLPLLIWLHGGGQAEYFRYMFPLAEELGVVILALDARHNTWDSASYALALGRATGDIFTHLIAVAPGYLELPSPVTYSALI